MTQPPNDPASREQAFLLNTSMIVVPALFDGFAWVLDAEYQHALGGGWAVVVQTIDVALLPETDHEDEISLLGFGLYGGVKRSWGDGALDGFYLKAILGPFVLAPFDAEGEFAEDVGVGLMALGGLGYQWILELGFTAELGVALGAGGTFAQEPLLFPAANVEGRIGYAW